MFAFPESVEVFRAEIVQETYTRKRDWGNAVRVWSGPADVQPDRIFEERSPERETAQERLMAYLPYGADVQSADRILYRDQWYEVDGPPLEWPHGSLRHTAVRMWKAEN